MSQEGHTVRTEFMPEVKDYADGSFRIELNPYYPSLPILHDGVLGLEFRHKMSVKDADDFARLFHEKIKSITFTKLTGAGKREPVKPIARGSSRT